MNAAIIDNRLATEILAEEQTLSELRGMFQKLSPRSLRVYAQTYATTHGFGFKLAQTAAAELIFQAYGQQNPDAHRELNKLTPAEKKGLYNGVAI
jgi:hypothetical protein